MITFDYQSEKSDETLPVMKWTRSARMGETSMNGIDSIKQYLKLIYIELPRKHQVSQQFEDWEYLKTSIFYS